MVSQAISQVKAVCQKKYHSKLANNSKENYKQVKGNTQKKCLEDRHAMNLPSQIGEHRLKYIRKEKDKENRLKDTGGKNLE